MESEKEVDLQLRMSTTVISVIFKAAEIGDLRLKEKYALYEVSETMEIGNLW